MDFIGKLKKHIENSDKRSFIEKVTKKNKSINLNKDIDNLINGEYLANDFGECFLRKTIFSNDYNHGEINLNRIYEIDLEIVNLLLSCNENIDIEKMLFLDTETTGLSSGTGTIAFLVGIGYFLEGNFILKQFFLKDYDQEPAMLNEFLDIVSNYEILVSFNGKAFDWNLLNTRLLLNRVKINDKNFLHLDLLHISRNIWNKKLESCRLASIEENILNIRRNNDIPGMFIPKLYFEYLQTRDGINMKRVIEHNEIDILSMITLLVKIIDICEDPIINSFDWYEIIGVGNIYEKRLNFNRAKDIFKHCTLSENKYIKVEAYKKLVNLYRKEKDYKNMGLCLNKIIKVSDLPTINTMIDLAKFYEHKEKDYNTALKIVDRAIEDVLKFNAMRKLYLKDLKYRRDRINKKLKKNNY
ncbi:MAG: ribonuclease H-like domain-containing protein [Clostridiales bacterium]